MGELSHYTQICGNQRFFHSIIPDKNNELIPDHKSPDPPQLHIPDSKDRWIDVILTSIRRESVGSMSARCWSDCLRCPMRPTWTKMVYAFWWNSELKYIFWSANGSKMKYVDVLVYRIDCWPSIMNIFLPTNKSASICLLLVESNKKSD